MDHWSSLMSVNTAETLFGVAAIAIAYSVARLLNAAQPVALAVSLIPLATLWAWNDPGMRHMLMGQFA